MMDNNTIVKNFNEKNLSLVRKYIFEILVVLLLVLTGFQWYNQRQTDNRFIEYLNLDKGILIHTIENNTQAIQQNNLILQTLKK